MQKDDLTEICMVCESDVVAVMNIAVKKKKNKIRRECRSSVKG